LGSKNSIGPKSTRDLKEDAFTEVTHQNDERLAPHGSHKTFNFSAGNLIKKAVKMINKLHLSGDNRAVHDGSGGGGHMRATTNRRL
jgi:hypothetical protein